MEAINCLQICATMMLLSKMKLELVSRLSSTVLKKIDNFQHLKERVAAKLPWGPSIKYVMLFLANFYPPPPVTHYHTSQYPPQVLHTSRTPPFLVGLVKKSGQKPPLQILSQLFARAFVRGLLSGGFLSGRFCPGWFLSIPPSVRIHLLQQKVKNHFKFHVSYV